MAAVGSSRTDEPGLLNDAANLLMALDLTDESRPDYVASPDVAVRLAVSTDSGVQDFPGVTWNGGEIYGVPLLVSGGLDANTLLLVDAAKLAGNAGDASDRSCQPGQHPDGLCADNACGCR